MNLKEFFEYRQTCPICKDVLVTSFHSQKKQSIRYEDDRFVVLFRMDSLKKKGINYKVGYSFGLEDHSWYVEFYTQDDKRFENDSPNFLRERFKELDKNLGQYKFYRHCTGCCCYNYSSNDFYLDYDLGSINDLIVNVEYIGMLQPIETGFKVYKLLNDYGGSKSTIVFGKHPSENIARSDAGVVNKKPHMSNYYSSFNLDMIQVPLIKFSSQEETMERIRKLLIFS